MAKRILRKATSKVSGALKRERGLSCRDRFKERRALKKSGFIVFFVLSFAF